jgi:hypothetical protein
LSYQLKKAITAIPPTATTMFKLFCPIMKVRNDTHINKEEDIVEQFSSIHARNPSPLISEEVVLDCIYSDHIC